MSGTTQALRPEVDTVPNARDMDHETFLKHFNARHLEEAKLGAPLEERTARQDAVIRAYRAFHRRCHELGVPGQFDHEHIDDWD